MVCGARRRRFLREMEKGSDNSFPIGCCRLVRGKDSTVVVSTWAMAINSGQLGGRLSFSWMMESLDLSREVCGHVS